MRIKKGIVAIAFLILLTSVQFTCSNAAAENSSSITMLDLDEAIERAVNNNYRIKVLDRTIEDMWENHVKLTDASKAIQDQLDHMENYTRLYNKLHSDGEKLTYEETQLYKMYMLMYGPEPPVMSSEELFYTYVRDRDFLHYSYWASIKNTQTNRDLMVSNISLSVRQLYENILSMQDTLALQKELLASLEFQNRQISLKFDKGLVSEYDKFVADINLAKQKLGIAKLERSLENAKMSLKQLTGIPLDHEVSLVPYDAVYPPGKPDSYEKYLEKALNSRAEVTTARLDLQVKQRELDIMKQYIRDELSTDRWEAQLSYEEKKMAYDEAIENVKSDIYDAYKSLLQKQEEVRIAQSKKSNAELQYDRTKRLYNAGLISLSDLMASEITLYQEKISLIQTVRDYNFCLYRLELACGIGPGFSNSMGGY
ncbi:MAG TPA: TolC family protein [Thermoclostridium sp.]